MWPNSKAVEALVLLVIKQRGNLIRLVLRP